MKKNILISRTCVAIVLASSSLIPSAWSMEKPTGKRILEIEEAHDIDWQAVADQYAPNKPPVCPPENFIWEQVGEKNPTWKLTYVAPSQTKKQKLELPAPCITTTTISGDILLYIIEYFYPLTKNPITFELPDDEQAKLQNESDLNFRTAKRINSSRLKMLAKLRQVCKPMRDKIDGQILTRQDFKAHPLAQNFKLLSPELQAFDTPGPRMLTFQAHNAHHVALGHNMEFIIRSLNPQNYANSNDLENYISDTINALFEARLGGSYNNNKEKNALFIFTSTPIENLVCITSVIYDKNTNIMYVAPGIIAKREPSRPTICTLTMRGLTTQISSDQDETRIYLGYAQGDDPDFEETDDAKIALIVDTETVPFIKPQRPYELKGPVFSAFSLDDVAWIDGKLISVRAALDNDDTYPRNMSELARMYCQVNK